MSTLLKLGPTIGINPGSKVSFVLGKNIIAELEQKEVELAYQEQIRKLEAAEITAQVAAQAQAEQNVQQAADLRQQIEGEFGA